MVKRVHATNKSTSQAISTEIPGNRLINQLARKSSRTAVASTLVDVTARKAKPELRQDFGKKRLHKEVIDSEDEGYESEQELERAFKPEQKRAPSHAD